jgi:hypothetical protein
MGAASLRLHLRGATESPEQPIPQRFFMAWTLLMPTVIQE